MAVHGRAGGGVGGGGLAALQLLRCCTEVGGPVALPLLDCCTAVLYGAVG